MTRQHEDDGGLAFPAQPIWSLEGAQIMHEQGGMSLREWFAGQALSNPALCTGEARDYELRCWFGERSGVTREEIVAAQAYAFADQMLVAARKGD